LAVDHHGPQVRVEWMMWQAHSFALVATCFRVRRVKRPEKHFHDHIVVAVVV
jgi:hypothetical protein